MYVCMYSFIHSFIHFLMKRLQQLPYNCHSLFLKLIIIIIIIIIIIWHLFLKYVIIINPPIKPNYWIASDHHMIDQSPLYLLQCREFNSLYISGYLLELNIEPGNFWRKKKIIKIFLFN
jgi:hypothetical protein